MNSLTLHLIPVQTKVKPSTPQQTVTSFPSCDTLSKKESITDLLSSPTGVHPTFFATINQTAPTLHTQPWLFKWKIAPSIPVFLPYLPLAIGTYSRYDRPMQSPLSHPRSASYALMSSKIKIQVLEITLFMSFFSTFHLHSINFCHLLNSVPAQERY